MIIIIIDDRILNFLDGILIGIFRWENVLNFHGRKNRVGAAFRYLTKGN